MSKSEPGPSNVLISAGRGSLQVVLCGMLVQLLGFLKLLLIAHWFGVSLELDAYYLALVVPALLQGFIGGALQTGFVPVYMQLQASDAAQAGDLAGQVFVRLLWGLLFVSIVLSLSSSFFLPLCK